MSKTQTVLHFVDMGKEYKVIRYFGENNPYRIYEFYNDYNKYGFLTNHRKLMVKYADMISCFYWFVQHNIGR